MATLDLVSAGETNWATQQNANLTALNTELIATTAKANAAQVAADLDDDTATLAADSGSALRTELNAAYVPKKLIYLSSYGIVADATDATITAETATDCTTLIQDAFDDAVDAFGNVIATVVHDVVGVDAAGTKAGVLYSAPIDMHGASMVGNYQRDNLFFSDPSVAYATWSIGENPNDLAGFHAKNKSDWTVERVGFDGANTYTQPLVAWGGDFIHFRHCYARRIAKCGFQFMGSRSENDSPVRYSTMEGLWVEDCVWSLVMDGEQYGNKIINCISIRPTARHVSIDPTAAYGGADVNLDFEVSGIRGFGTGTPPAGWASFPVVDDPSHAVAVGAADCHVSGRVHDIVVRDWFTNKHVFEFFNFAGQAWGLEAHSATTIADTIPVIQVGGNDQLGTADISGVVSSGYQLGIRAASGAKYTKAHDNTFFGATKPADFSVAGQGSMQWNNRAADGADDVLIRTIDPAIAVASAGVGAANQAYFARVDQGGYISKIGVWVDTASGNIDVGVFTRGGGSGRTAYHGARRVAAGSTALSTTGYVEITLSAPVMVQPGDWFAVALDNTTAKLRANVAAHVADTMMAGRSYYKGSSFPLPTGGSSQGVASRLVFAMVGVA
ncbi:MAG: hypothetical protein Tp182DCM212571_41 [Prokaryotic dsDNA virus sp.]|nr:MAG: hypothetical protein Tp182DCM212571_41 [Prokaryotic dsDNA virus sp.]|tara:strand:+ start:21172 stop:23013 length:1842 start_codon:yes stop_codon:yes gene_type:complete